MNFKVPNMKSRASMHRFSLPLKFQQFLSKQWANYYAGKFQLEAVEKCLRSVLEREPGDTKALLYSSKSRRIRADIAGALEFAEIARALKPDVSVNCLEVAVCLYEANNFEIAKVELHDGLRKFGGLHRKPFVDVLSVLDQNLVDTLGPSWIPIIMENEPILNKVMDKMCSERFVDERPLWKILRERNECDVHSELQPPNKLISPIGKARLERKLLVGNQHYLHNSWVDLEFLRKLCLNPSNLATPSMPNLPEYTKNSYENALNFIKMLNAREPLYKIRYDMQSDKKKSAKWREDFLFRIQLKTVRNIHTALRIMRYFRKEKKFYRMQIFVDGFMANYMDVKTLRVIPGKLEYIYEILNMLGLAFVDKYLKNNNWKRYREYDRFIAMLGLRPNKATGSTSAFRFGDRYLNPEYQEFYDLSVHGTFKARARTYQTSLTFAKYDIQRAYLLYQIGALNLEYNHYSECCAAARRAFSVAIGCSSHLWAFLSLMLICKAHTLLQRFENQKEVLEMAHIYARKLKNRNLVRFIDYMQELVEAEIQRRRAIFRKSDYSYLTFSSEHETYESISE